MHAGPGPPPEFESAGWGGAKAGALFVGPRIPGTSPFQNPTLSWKQLPLFAELDSGLFSVATFLGGRREFGRFLWFGPGDGIGGSSLEMLLFFFLLLFYFKYIFY